VKGNKGVLMISLSGEHGDKINGSVCASNFSWWKANLFCHHLGYETGKWGSYPGNFKYVSE